MLVCLLCTMFSISIFRNFTILSREFSLSMRRIFEITRLVILFSYMKLGYCLFSLELGIAKLCAYYFSVKFGYRSCNLELRIANPHSFKLMFSFCEFLRIQINASARAWLCTMEHILVDRVQIPFQRLTYKLQWKSIIKLT